MEEHIDPSDNEEHDKTQPPPGDPAADALRPAPDDQDQPAPEEQAQDQGAPEDESQPRPEPLTPEQWQERNDGLTMESVIEAVLFASDEPVTPAKLSDICEAGSERIINEHIRSLNDQYESSGRSFRIERIAGGYQMLTLEAYNHWLTRLVKVRGETKLTQAALETLAIIAYKQPIIRAEVEAIRGVSSGEMIRSLMYKGVVKIVGRADVLGRPLLYGTTKKFLQLFGLNSLKDLPKVEELKKPQ